MEKFKDFRKSGLFKVSSDVEVLGELSLRYGATSLDLYSTSFFNTNESDDISGIFHDRTKVSLLKCFTTSGPGSGTRGGEHYYFSSVFPHFALFGEEHISSSDRKIVSVSFAVDDAAAVFYEFGAFGSVIEARPYMVTIAEAKESSWAMEVGEHPLLFYFNGKFEIFSVDTVLGKVSATHRIDYTNPGPTGIHVKSTIFLNITFATEQTVAETIAAVMDTLRFLEVIAGRPQNISELIFLLPTLTDGRRPTLDTYWSLPPQRDEDVRSDALHPGDLPLQAGRDPKAFATVLAHWLERNDEWRTARARYSIASAKQNRYDTDRLVGAANMFDILPGSACAAVVELPPTLEGARDAAREAFRKLPSSPERDSVLNTLGRIGKPTLKRKIRSRAKLITDAVGDEFADLELVTDHAVDCRNFYVHGTPAKFSYLDHSDQSAFLTDTLEFVFAASDLIEAGWNIAEWMKESTAMSHPFGRYRVAYAGRLAALKSFIA